MEGVGLRVKKGGDIIKLWPSYFYELTSIEVHTIFGPSGVRALTLGCRHKGSGHSTWRYFSSSLSLLLIPLLFYQKEGS